MSEQDGRQATTIQCPTNDDPELWKAYWKEQGHPWRTEPEIDAEHQAFLTERQSIIPDIKQGIYPFKAIKLSRADVEWLLAMHDDGRGPVDWSDKKDLHERRGLDLRGSDLRLVNLNNLPLTHLYGGLDQDERDLATVEEGEMAAIHLEGASLKRTRLERANLYGAHLEKTDLTQAHLEGVYLLRSTLGDESAIGPRLVNVRWGDANLAVVRWSQVKMLADEYEATLLEEQEQAVIATRQLSIALLGQGLNEDAARFAYRAQLVQRKVFWYQGFRSFGRYLFSLFLALLTGYGYKPIRSFIAYAVVISVFAIIYFLLGKHLAWNEAIVISMTAFHGRGFFPDQFHPGDPQALVAAIEAFVGLLIEVTFIATLTQRLFGK